MSFSKNSPKQFFSWKNLKSKSCGALKFRYVLGKKITFRYINRNSTLSCHSFGGKNTMRKDVLVIASIALIVLQVGNIYVLWVCWFTLTKHKTYCIFYIYIRKFNAFSSAKPSWFSEIHAFSPKNMHFSPKNMQFSPKNMQFFLKYMHFSIYVLKRLNRGRWYTFWIGWRHLAAIWDIKRT